MKIFICLPSRRKALSSARRFVRLSVVWAVAGAAFCGPVAAQNAAPPPDQAPVRTEAETAPRPGAPLPAPSAGETPEMDFEQALALAEWDASAQGAILVVGAKGIPPGGGPYSATGLAHAMNADIDPNAPSDTPVFDPKKRYPIGRIAKAYGQKIERAGAVTVLATQNIMNPAAAQEGFLASMTQGVNRVSQGDRWLALLATLSPEQWRKLGSASGLGLADVTPGQKPLFQAALPQKTARLQRTTISPGPSQEESIGEPVAVSAAEMAQTRLRLTRRVTYAFAPRPNGSSVNNLTGGGFMPLERAPAPVSYTLTPDSSDDEDDVSDPAALMARMVTQTRLRRSDSDLSDAFWDKSVYLDGAKTVGELIARIAEATGAKLYPDVALENKPLWTRTPGLPVRAGDALTALCWGTSGMVRRVADEAKAGDATPPAAVLLLTAGDDDGAGVAAARSSHTTLVAMTTMGQAQFTQQRNRQSLVAQTRGVGPLALLGQHPGDPFAAPEELTRKIEARLRQGKEALLSDQNARSFGSDSAANGVPPLGAEAAEGLKIPVTALPAALQAALKTQVARQNARNAEAIEAQREAFREAQKSSDVPVEATEENMVGQLYTLDPQRALLNLELVAEYLFPGDRAVEEGEHLSPWELLAAEPKPLPPPAPLAFPPLLETRAAQIATQNEDDAVRLVGALAERGFTEVWADTGPVVVTSERAAQTDAVLRAAIAAGKARGVRVRAVVHLFQAASDALADAPLDLRDPNILGEMQSASARRLYSDARASLGLGKENAGESSSYFDIIRAVVGGDENADWLRSDDARVVPLIARRLQAIVQTPGLAGVVAVDTCPPGFQPAKASPSASDSLTFGEEFQFGFTPRARFAFTQSHHKDPLDLRLSDLFNMAMNSGGGEPDARDPQTLAVWRSGLYDQNAARVGEALALVRANGAESVPLYIEDRGGSGMSMVQGRFVVPFPVAATPQEAKNALPYLARSVEDAFGGGGVGTITGSVKAKWPIKPGAPRPLLTLDFRRTDLFRSVGAGMNEPLASAEPTPVRFARFAQAQFATLRRTSKVWGGVAFDFTGLSTDEIILILQTFAPAAPPPAVGKPPVKPVAR